MKPEEDAVGQFLWARYNGKDSYEVIEREDGYIDAMSTKAYFSQYGDWPAHEQKSMESLKGKVLDVGCGAGRQRARYWEEAMKDSKHFLNLKKALYG